MTTKVTKAEKNGFYFIEFSNAAPGQQYIEVGDIDHPERRLRLNFRWALDGEIAEEKSAALKKGDVLISEYVLNGLEQTDGCRLTPSQLVVKLIRMLGLLLGSSLSRMYVHYDVVGKVEGLNRYVEHDEESAWQSLARTKIIDDVNAINACGWIFEMRGKTTPLVLLHDPEPVEFMPEWLDNIGSMANAIPWLQENWKHNYNATGVHFHNGHRWMWNWSPSTQVLMVHTTEQGEHGAIRYEIVLNQIIRFDGPSSHWYTIYRPFVGLNVGITPRLDVAWLKTQQVTVQSFSERSAIPINKREMVLRAERLLGQSPIGAYPLIKFSLPVNGRSIKRDERIDSHQAAAYSDLIHQIKITSDGTAFVDHHMPAYWALRAQIEKFCRVMGWLDAWPEGSAPYPRGMYHDESDRLLEMGEFHAAALAYTFLHEQGDIAHAREVIRLRRGMPDQ